LENLLLCNEIFHKA